MSPISFEMLAGGRLLRFVSESCFQMLRKCLPSGTGQRFRAFFAASSGSVQLQCTCHALVKFG